MEVDTKTLMKMETLLKYPVSMDHYCEEEGCSVENPHCAEMHTAAAMVLLRGILEPEHVSLQPSRMANDAERIFAEHWKHENERHPAINRGYTALEWIMCPTGQEYPDRITQRDAHVAASVAQWLGTGYGWCYLNSCEHKIKQARIERSKWRDFVQLNRPAPPTDLATAELLAGPFIAGNRKAYQDLVMGIVGALQVARMEVSGGTLSTLMESASCVKGDSHENKT